MSLGSAASLRAAQPQVPLSPARSHEPFALISEASNASRPPPHHLETLTAAQPPRGQVLIVEDDPVMALSLQKLLLNLGYRAIGPATSLPETKVLLDRRSLSAPVTCALVAAGITDASEVANTLQARSIPFAWIVDEEVAPGLDFGAPVLQAPIDRESLLRAIREATSPNFYVKPPPQALWPRTFPPL